MQRYSGTVKTVITNKGRPHGFIGLASITKDDQSPHGLDTTQDPFIHQDDCDSALRQGLSISFELVPDEHRGGDALRAVDVVEVVVGELVLVGENAGASRELTDPRSLYVPPTPAQRGLMKPISPEAIHQVLVNRPMPSVPRTGGEQSGNTAELVNQLMRRIFPQFVALDAGGVEMADEKFDEIIKEALEDHKSLGLLAQAGMMKQQAKAYKGLRTLLKSHEDLLRPETLIPMQYLPDLFMAVPVWYFWADEVARKDIAALGSESDPRVHSYLTDICDLVPSSRWIDTFLMFNRRIRTLADYEGDVIPPKVIARMRKMAPLFDHMVIMTPYHDVAGTDWEDFDWMRNLDPYVVGFLKGVPLMLVIGRFSDSGTFPLYSELVADTIAFLRAKIMMLRGFNRVDSPYWYRPGKPLFYFDGKQTGNKLVQHTKELLAAFDAGNLFPWLRGEDENLPARS
ncbi:MAG: hypothetical protein AAB927_01790 [Patescibacteria group bacterium]